MVYEGIGLLECAKFIHHINIPDINYLIKILINHIFLPHMTYLSLTN